MYELSQGSDAVCGQKPKPPSSFWFFRMLSIAPSMVALTSGGSLAPKSFARSRSESSGKVRLTSCSVQPYG